MSSEEIDRDLIYVPGVWRCAKCQFTLIQSNLNAADGTVTARDVPGDKCPNDRSPLWRVSYRDWALENEKGWQELLDRKDQEIAALASSQPIMSSGDVEALLCGNGWVAFNPDTGDEYSPNHPVTSGECVEAENVRRSTAQEDALWNGMQVQFHRAEFLSAPAIQPPLASGDVVMVPRELPDVMEQAYLTALHDWKKRSGLNMYLSFAWPQILAAAPAILSSEGERDQTAWLIEHGSMASPMYWTAGRNGIGGWGKWEGDHRNAIRFARREDAFAVSLVLGDMPNDPPHRIAEHKWISK